MLNQGGKEGVIHLFVDEFRRPIHLWMQKRLLGGISMGAWCISYFRLVNVSCRDCTAILLTRKINTILPTSLKDQSFGYRALIA